MKCVQPARSWLPQVGCTDLQFHAVIACKHLARHNIARRKIAGDDNYKGIEALINLLRTGSLEAQSHTAHALACLAEDPSLSFAVRLLPSPPPPPFLSVPLTLMLQTSYMDHTCQNVCDPATLCRRLAPHNQILGRLIDCCPYSADWAEGRLCSSRGNAAHKDRSSKQLCECGDGSGP